MIRSGVSLSRSVELTAQWDRVVALGPLYFVTLDDLSLDQTMGIGAFHYAASDVHRRLSDFVQPVVVHRRGGGGIGFGKIPWCIRIGGFVQIWFSQLHFFSVSLILRLVVLGCACRSG